MFSKTLVERKTCTFSTFGFDTAIYYPAISVNYGLLCVALYIIGHCLFLYYIWTLSVWHLHCFMINNRVCCPDHPWLSVFTPKERVIHAYLLWSVAVTCHQWSTDPAERWADCHPYRGSSVNSLSLNCTFWGLMSALSVVKCNTPAKAPFTTVTTVHNVTKNKNEIGY